MCELVLTNNGAARQIKNLLLAPPVTARPGEACREEPFRVVFRAMRHTLASAWIILFVVLAPVARGNDAIESAEPFDPASGRDVRNYPPDPQVDFQHIKLDLRMPDPMSR